MSQRRGEGRGEEGEGGREEGRGEEGEGGEGGGRRGRKGGRKEREGGGEEGETQSENKTITACMVGKHMLFWAKYSVTTPAVFVGFVSLEWHIGR